ncbi:MAG: multicopper oxidase family protein [Candidatus Thorarchaeota archaeon]
MTSAKAKKASKTLGIVLVIFLPLSIQLVAVQAAAPVPIGLLDPTTIPKFVTQLTGPPPVYNTTDVLDSGGNLVKQTAIVDMTEFSQQVLPLPFPQTPVWGYGGLAHDALTGDSLGYVHNQPGPTFEAIRGIPIEVEYQNKIVSPHMFPVDPTLHWANPNNVPMGTYVPPFTPYPPGYPEAQSPVPLIPHLHGGEVQSTSDGHPEAWFTASGIHGPEYNTENPTADSSAIFYYPNAQPATTLWYHDHALGITRINVMSGLAGFYLLRDPNDSIAPLLPSGKYEMPLVLQDRTFKTDGSFWFPEVGVDPGVHPYWQPEFFGNVIMVNGLAWPNMNVDQGQYRFRLLDGSNARFYTLKFWVPSLDSFLPFIQIGSDGGYLRTAAALTELTIAPGERADVLVDFSGLPTGTKVILKNTAKTPFPKGTPADPKTVGKCMQFTVGPNPGPAPAALPPLMNPTLSGVYPTLPLPILQRTLPLFEVMGPLGPTMVTLNGQLWSGVVTETPTLGTTEEWVIVNPTADAHPIHLHLTQFQVVSRQNMQTAKYAADWMALNGMPPLPEDVVPTEIPVGPYLNGQPYAPPLNEQGWKDTVQVYPGQVTIIRVRFAPIDGSPAYPFDATSGPGYVWHCHILDHEDNEMMRPYIVINP